MTTGVTNKEEAARVGVEARRKGTRAKEEAEEEGGRAGAELTPLVHDPPAASRDNWPHTPNAPFVLESNAQIQSGKQLHSLFRDTNALLQKIFIIATLLCSFPQEDDGLCQLAL